MEKKKMKLWKKILIVIGILLLIFVVRTARNMIIIKNLSNKVSKYQENTNYHITTYNYKGDTVNITECYNKDGKYLVKVNASDIEHTRKLINYCDGTTVNTYMESDGNKIAMLNSNGLPSAGQITNYFEMDNLWQFVVMSVCSTIKSEICDGKECYKIGNLMPSSVILYSGERVTGNIDFSIYFEKETGLMIRQYNGTVENDRVGKINMVTDCKYEFDTVTDEDLVEPDISEYQIQEN